MQNLVDEGAESKKPVNSAGLIVMVRSYSKVGFGETTRFASDPTNWAMCDLHSKDDNSNFLSPEP